MSSKTSSDTLTDSIRVIAEPVFQPFHSSENEKRFLFSYDISIRNEGPIGVTLRSRKWSIINSEGEEIIVRGEGVVGEQPFIAPGETYKCSSFCVLDTPFGTMEGFFIMEQEDGDVLQVSIGRFYLNVPVNSVD